MATKKTLPKHPKRTKRRAAPARSTAASEPKTATSAPNAPEPETSPVDHERLALRFNEETPTWNELHSAPLANVIAYSYMSSAKSIARDALYALHDELCALGEIVNSDLSNEIVENIICRMADRALASAELDRRIVAANRSEVQS